MKLEEQDGEFETVLNEISHATSLPHHQKQRQQRRHPLYNRYVDNLVENAHGSSPRKPISGISGDGDRSCHDHAHVSPVNGVSLCRDESLPRLSLTVDPVQGTRTHHQNGFWVSNELELPDSLSRNEVHGSLTDDFGLSDEFCGVSIRDKEECVVRFDEWSPNEESGSCNDPLGLLFDNRFSVGFNHGNVGVNSPFEGRRNGFSNDYTGLGWLGPQNSVVDEDRRLSMLGLLQLQHHYMVNLSGSCPSSRPLSGPFPNQVNFTGAINLQGHETLGQQSDNAANILQLPAEAAYGGNSYHHGIQVPNASLALNRASVVDELFCTGQSGNCSIGNWYELKSQSSSHMTTGFGDVPHCSLTMFSDTVGGTPNGWAPCSPPLTRGAQYIDAFSCEDSHIIQAKDLNFVIRDTFNLPRGHNMTSNNDHWRWHLGEKDFASDEIECGQRMHWPCPLPLKYNSLKEIEGYIYVIAKDQRGCRFLQQQLDEGTHEDVQMIFNEISNHVVELMVDAFGNYLMQKLLDVCSEEQRNQILLAITGQPGQLIAISLNTHGTRAVQKLIETLKTREQISLAVKALEPGFLDLIKDLNGNHVIQRCLQCLSKEDNKFIFYAAAKYCVDIATHRHGCCVLKRCITHSIGEHREKLVGEISSNGLLLAQDAFGNYAIQYILDLRMPWAIAILTSQFEGKYVHLSMQKFSSNVVEKCLHAFPVESRSRIIHELLATSRFEQLLQDPFANYVIQSALAVSKGPLHASLVEAIRPFAAVLRTNPYCKRVLLHALSKK